MTVGDVGVIRFQLFEVSQLIQPEQAQFPEPRVVYLSFFQSYFAADHFVAGGRVALKFNAPYIELLAFVDVNVEEDYFFSSSNVVFGMDVKLM